MNDSDLFENSKNNNAFEPRINLRKNDILAFIEKAQLDKDKALSKYSNASSYSPNPSKQFAFPANDSAFNGFNL